MASEPRCRDIVGGRRNLIAGTALMSLALTFCLLVYRPWEMVHFPMRDQGTLLGQFHATDSFGEAFTHLAGILLEQGRIYPLSVMALSASWSAFGIDAAAWQIARFITSFVCVILAWSVLRRCGATWLGATLGASLFAVAGGVVSGWTYTMVLEMYGLPFLLAALWIAAGFYGTTRPRADVAGVAGMLLLAIFSKETFVACAPSVILLALCHRGAGIYGPPRIFNTRDRMMAMTVVGAVLIVGLMPAVIARTVAPTGHAGNYSFEHVTWNHALVVLRAIFSIATWVWAYPANLVAGILVALGTVAGFRIAPRSTIWALTVAVSLPVAGWVLYLPWRFTLGYYGIPYLFGLSLLLANAVSQLERAASQWRIGGIAVLGAGMIAYASLVGRNETAQFQAESFVEGEAAATIARKAPAALRVAAPDGVGWVAADMGSYVKAYGGPPQLSATSVSCGESRSPRQAGAHSLLVTFSHICPETAEPGPGREEIRRTYPFLEWKSWTKKERWTSVTMQDR